MHEIASGFVCFGFCRIFVFMRREEWKVSHKRVYRLHKEEGLNLRTKRPRRNRSAATWLDRPVLRGANQLWIMVIVSDDLFNGKRFRSLTLLANHMRKCLTILLGQSLSGACVSEALSNFRASGLELPKRIQTDNDPVFMSVALDKWTYDNKAVLGFSRPGKPTDNPFVESFNESFSDECLGCNWCMSLDDA